MRQQVKWRFSGFFLILLGALVLAGCTPAPTPSVPAATSGEEAPSGTTETIGADLTSAQGETLVRIHTTSSVGTHFNPIWFVGTGSQWHTFPFIWYPLVFYGIDGQMEPWLAESIESSPDAKVWTFHLHQNATWTDGEPVTADDVKFSWELLTNPQTQEIGAVGHFILPYIAGMPEYLDGTADSVSGIEVIDDYTIRFTLIESNPLFLYDAYVFVMPEHVLGGVPILELPNHPYVDDPTVTSGPYVLSQYEPRNFIELEVRQDWWGEHQPTVDRAVLAQVSSDETVLNMLAAGELDMSPYMSMEMVERLEAMDGIQVIPQLSPGISHIYVNGRKEYLKDKRVRKAFAHAIDRDILNEIQFNGAAVPIYSDVSGPEWAVSPNLIKYEYDPELARQLLEEAGWDFDRTLVYYSGSGEETDVRALYLQAAFRDIGVELEILSAPFSSTIDAYASNTFDLASWGGGNLALDPHFALDYYTCGGAWSQRLDYCNPRLEELRVAGMATTDQAERQAVYWEAGEILNEELPIIYLFRPPTVYSVSDRITNFEAPLWFRFANVQMPYWELAE